MIQVAGYKPGTVIDFEVPKKRGLRQTIADTLGIGGIMRGLRTAPVLIDIARDMAELCPNALMLQYVNPMAINCAALSRVVPEIRTVGLCHSVQGTAKELAADIGVPTEEIRYLCAGINHMAFYLKFERRLPDGSMEDLYPRIRKVIEEGRVPDWNRVRYEVFRHFGYFVTESSEHFSEYVPWFIKRDRPDLIEKFNIPLDEYIRRCEVQIARWDKQEKELTSNGEDGGRAQQGICRPASSSPRLTGEPIVINGNVENRGYIDNLPDGTCVEVPCLIDHNGVQPISVGRLPPQLAALMQTNINVQELTVEAIVTGRIGSCQACGHARPAHRRRAVAARRYPTSSTICCRPMATGCRAAPSGTRPDAAWRKRRVALVGTGHRGAGTWGRELLANCGEWVELVGLCDSNLAARWSAPARRSAPMRRSSPTAPRCLPRRGRTR